MSSRDRRHYVRELHAVEQAQARGALRLNLTAAGVLVCVTQEVEMPVDKSQGIVRNKRGEEQPADEDRAKKVTSVEEKKKTEAEVQKTAEKSGF
jgi:hypothetical protein